MSTVSVSEPLVGEVITTRRTRNRNIVRSAEILPPDVETKVVALQTLDAAAQAAAVTAMLSHSRTGLLAAIAAQDLPQIVEWKAKGAAIQEIAKQVRLGKELQLDAAEFQRRAERGLGVAIRDGQAAGTVETITDAKSRGASEWRIKAGSSTKSPADLVDSSRKTRVSDLLSKTEQTGGRSAEFSVFRMVDGVSDEQFAEALAEARADGKLSRANVARKARAKVTVAVDADDPLIDAQIQPAPQPKPRVTKHDSTAMLTNIAGMLGGVVESIKFMHPSEIDAAESRTDIQKIRHHIGAVRKFLKEIENG